MENCDELNINYEQIRISCLNWSSAAGILKKTPELSVNADRCLQVSERSGGDRVLPIT
jgi:hypothetical protein